jgi:DNA-binding GntR family transcriptional regulator
LKEHKIWLQAIRDQDAEEVYRIVKHHKTEAFRQLEEVMK